MIRVILWDIDGTLLNFKAAQSKSLRILFKEFNLGNLDEDMILDYDHINHLYWEKLERGEISKPEVLVNRFKDFFNKYDINCDVDLFNSRYQETLGDTAVFYENGESAVKSLKGMGIRQFAVTNGTKVAQDRKLKNSGLINILDEIFISDNIGHEKPNKEFFIPVFKKLEGINLDEIMIVGDSLTSDIQGGVNVGIKTCWFNPNGSVNNKGLNIDFEIKGLKEVLDIVNNHS